MQQNCQSRQESSSDTDQNKQQYLSTSDHSTTNKRALKQQNKGTPQQKQAKADQSASPNEESDSQNPNLTKKKLEYLNEVIYDKNGVFSYEDNPVQYKKARKRLQNRESAVRSRVKKREEVDDLEKIVRQLEEEKAAMESENQALKRQNEYFQGLFAKQQNVTPANLSSTQSGSSAVGLSASASHKGADSSAETHTQQDEAEASRQPLEMTCGSFIKRQKTDDHEIDFFNINGKEPFAGLQRQDSFVSDAQAYSLLQKQEISMRETQFETGSEQFLPHQNSFSDFDKSESIEPQPPLVLQRNQISIGGFMAGNGLFGLTIVCAVLGIMSNSYMQPEANSFREPHGINSGQHFRADSHSQALYRCQHYNECGPAVWESLLTLFGAIKMFLLSLPRVSLTFYILAFIMLMVWLKPIKTLAYMITASDSSRKQHKSPSKSSHQKKRRSTTSSSQSRSEH